jgi:hypothetical protein
MRAARTKRAMEARKAMIERFGKDKSASFVEVATDLITHDRLFADLPRDRGEAIAFLDAYWLRACSVSRFGGVKPLPDGVTRASMGLA